MAVAFDAVGNISGDAVASLTSPLAWTHTPSGTPSAVYVCAGFSATTAYSAAAVACTYGGTTMTLLQEQDAGFASGGTSGFTVVFRLLSPPSGAQAVSLSWSGVTLNGTGKGVTAASVTVTGSTTDGNVTSGFGYGGGAGVTSGSLAVSSTATGNLCLCVVVDGSGGLAWTAGTQRWLGPTGGDNSTGAGYDWGATLASASGTTTFTWTQTQDYYGAIAVEAQAGGGTVAHLPVTRAAPAPPAAPRQVPPQVITGPPRVTALAGLATAAGTALQPTVQTSGSTTANAGLAAGTGAALGPVPVVTPGAGLAAGAGTAQPAAPAVTALAGLASGTGAALQPSATTSGAAGPAVTQASFTAIQAPRQLRPQVITGPAPVTVTAQAGLAAGTGTAQPTGPVVAPGAGLAAGTGTAQPPAAGAGTWRLMDGASGRPGVGSSGTQPPAAGASYSGNYLAGIVFQVTQGGLWFQGYWWWVPATGADTSGWDFALWNLNAPFSGTYYGTVIPGSTVTGGTLTAGQWNYIPLTSPLPLTPNIPYQAVTGKVVVTGFPVTLNQFNAGDPYPSGVTNGPLAMQATDSSYMTAISVPQMPFSTAGSDPATGFAVTNDHDDNLWLDVQVTSQAPAGATYRAWPSMGYPYPNIVTANDQTGYTLALEFSLSQACALQKIWHYSPTGSNADSGTSGGNAATVLPSRCAIWDVAGQVTVAGTDNTSPSWKKPDGTAASPADGWVYCDYSASGVTLAAGASYKVSTFHGAGADWFGAVGSIFGTGDFQASGFTSGPLTIPDDAAASPGQQSWNAASWAYPATSTGPEADWIDVEVTPSAGTTANAGLASGTGIAQAPVPAITASAGLAAATGTAQGPVPEVIPAAGLATGTGTAQQPGTEIDASAGLASSAGTTQQPTPVIIVAAGLATGTGTALNPTVNTSGSTTANAGPATGTGTAQSPVPAVTVLAGLASAAGTAQAPVPVVQAAAGLAAGTGTAQAPVPAIGASPALAIGSGSAPMPAVSVTVFAGLATAAGGVPQPVAVVQATLSVPAAAGAAPQPGITITVIAGLATGTGTTPQPIAGGGTTTAHAGLATAAGTAWQPVIPGYTGYVLWTASPLTPRWKAAPLAPRWKVARMQYEPISALSVEYIPILWNAELAGTEIDPTGQTPGQNALTVQFAVPVSSGNPLMPAQPSTWYLAVWLTGPDVNIRGYVANCAVGPTGGSPAGLVQLTAGISVDLWSRILGTPEQPVKYAGTLPVY